jgi:hypothetical protein
MGLLQLLALAAALKVPTANDDPPDTTNPECLTWHCE